MKIGVVGAQGFIGSHLVPVLRAAGYEVMEFVRGQILNFSGCDVVFNVAGVTGGSAFLAASPLAMVGPNLRLALDVFDAAQAHDVRHVIAMSSTTGYPDFDHPLVEHEYFMGDVPICYTNPGETRRFIERLGRMYQFDLTFIRCAGAYGPGDDFEPETSHVIAATIRKIAEKQSPLFVWGNGEEERDGTHIDDLVDALVRSIYLTGKQAINIGSGQLMSVGQMVEELANHSQTVPYVVYDTTRPQMIAKRVLDCSKARAVLGWEPRVSMKAGLCATLDWYRDHAGL